ncbi:MULTISPECIES: hypothetical protein [Methylobacter]
MTTATECFSSGEQVDDRTEIVVVYATLVEHHRSAGMLWSISQFLFQKGGSISNSCGFETGRFTIKEVLYGKYDKREIELTVPVGEWCSRIWLKSVNDWVLFLKMRGGQYEYQSMLSSMVLLDDKVEPFLTNPRTIEYFEKRGTVSAVPFRFSSPSQKLKILRDLNTPDVFLEEKSSSVTDRELFNKYSNFNFSKGIPLTALKAWLKSNKLPNDF